MLLAFIPLMALTAICICWKLGTPIIFSQVRPGLLGRPFRMFKFRTLTCERDSEGTLLPDELRLTQFGNVLRSTSLDELPELWNVLKGDMSLVGPRPLLLEYLEHYTPHQARRHEVRPGITGWAQINGRNAISWDQKLALDVWYVDNHSFRLDLFILWKSIWKVLSRDGINHKDRVSMPRFDDYMKAK